MGVSLGDLQRSFQSGLCRGEPPAGLAAREGFAVHASTMLTAALDALAANYPAVVGLVGQEWFRSAAAAYAELHPARDGRLARYGASFPEFLRDAPAAAAFPYLPDVARLDQLWLASYLAADAAPLTAGDLRDRSGEYMAGLRVAPHPAVRTLVSTWPVLAIWQASREGWPVDADLDWQPQTVLVTRPTDAVEVVAADAAAMTFLDRCKAGASLAACVDQVIANHASAQPDRLFAHLLSAGALILV